MSQQGNSDVKTYDIESQLSDIFAKIVKTPADKPGHHLDYEPQEANVDTLIAQSHSARLAKYQAWLQMCRNGSTYVHYSDFYTISDEEREYLAKVYKNAADVDLLTGGILEHSQNGSILGPTFTCMLAVQFNDLRKSDRFWYENDIPPTSFTHDQLNELRKVKFSGLLCANVPSIISIQPFAFVQPDPYLNAPIGCDHHGVFDLSAWRETPQETIKTMISMEMLQEAIRKAEDNVLRRQQTEFLLWSHKGGVDPKSPAGTAAAFSKPIKQALLLANNSILLEYASNEILNSLTEKVQKLRRRRQLDSGDNVIGFGPELPGKEFLSELDVSSFLPSLQSQSANSDEDCTEENGPCDPRSPYRTFNGHCNNPERPHLGKSLTTFARLLPAVYENGISSPRQTSVTGVPLPSPRLVSAMVHADISHLHNRYTLMVMQFAQFVDHDLTFTPVHRGFFASIPDCRSCDSPLTVHPECMPIPIPNNDPFYPQVNITSGERFCLPFMRSLPGQQRLGARAQVNQNTAYLDGSQIYGQNACQARSLRAYGGRLNVTVRHNGDKDLLPLSPVHPECKAPSGYCFIAGDGRASEQAALTAIHTVYLREHNRVVLGLRGVNPHWGDEKLYQTARRITVAAYQHITYNEFLPRLLGWGAVDLYGLRLTSQGYYKGYSSSCNPNIVTEFAVAAYRIGHSLLRPHLPRMSANYQAVNPAILLRDVFFNPDVIKQRYMIDELIRGLVSTPMEDLDQFITGEITNHLFEERRIPHSGMDLPALNVQRGRDHAIPSYNDYRTLCGMKRATNWEDLSRELPSEVIARLRRIYPSVNDIDLFPAGLSERAVQGGLVGPTFACIIGLQFRQLRQCDRFWYESGDPIVRFTEPQLAEIRKATLAKSLCDNLDVSGDIQRSVFDQPTDFGNPRLPCRSLPTMDFSVWRENAEQGCQIAGRIVPVGDTALPSPCTSCVCTNEGIDTSMNATQIVIDELKIPLKYIKESSKFDRVEALVHRTWLRHILTNWCVPEDFLLHEQLQPEEINAWFKQKENFGSNWQHIVIKVLEKSSTTVIPLPRTKVGAKPEAVLSYSQILHYVGQTNHKNIWKEAYKKYCHGSLPGIGEQKVQDSSRIQLTDSTTVFKEVIARAYCCPIISIDGTTPQIESDPKFETHPNLLSTSVVLETERYFLLLHEGSLSYTLQDCVSFSPAILSGSYAKPLFIIYQLLRLMRHLHDHGLALGDITLADIQLSQDLWIQVLPHLEANIYNIPKPVEKTVTTPVEVDNPDEESLVDVGNLCAAWAQGAVSNFDYLTSLNKLAGRRYGDPRSHHVFPWITDFTSHSGANWRDLTKSKFRLNKGDRQLDLTYELPPNCNVAQVPHHVSDVLSEITYYVYLARVTPKPILCKYVRPQWVPAEYPSSIQRLQQWTPDECIPEFFTDPSVFKSIHPDLPNLELPNWASSVQEFVTRHRAALESSHVSERLHYWIDLTFGYKLSGIAAVKSKNVCLQLVDGHTQLTDIGVVQLFTQPHPQRIGPSIYWSITPPRLQHNLHRDRRKVCSDDEEGHSSGDEDESVTNTSGTTPRSSPLGLSRLLSRSRNSLPTSSSLTPSSPSSEPSPSAANERSSSTSTCTIVLPHDYNPVAGLVALENLHNFIHKTSHVIYKGCENNSYSEITAFKQVVAARRVQEMQVLGCLIVEMFLATKLRVFGCGLQPIPFTQRLQICRTVLQTSSTNRDQIPRCVRSLVVLLLQIDVGSENESVQGVPFRYPTVTSFGIPPPSAHQLLQPNLTSNLLPFPSNFPIIYSMVKTLQEYSDVLAELRRVRLEKYPDGDVKGDMLIGVIEKLSEWKVKSVAQDLEKLVEDPMYGNITIGWMDLVLPYILNMLLDPATNVVTAWHLFDPIARALGPSRSATLLLEPMVRLYDCESERDSVIPESSPHRLKKRIKIYHRSFLLRLMIRFRMKVFLDNFIPPLVEGVGGYQDIETSNSVENMEMRAEMRENTGLLDCSEVEEATEWTGECILSPVDEDSSADSDKNHSTVTTIPTVLDQDGTVAEPELFVLETEDSTEDEESEQSKHTKCKSIQSLLLDQLEIQTYEADDSSTSSNTRSPVVNIPCRNKSLDFDSDDSSWKCRSDDSLNCQYEEKTKKNDLEYTKVSEVSVDSVTWLMHRLGPVLTARYLSRNLLRMLSLCYAGKGCQQRPGNDLSKLIGDDNAAKVLDCLASIAVVYGEQLIVLQYLPHMTDLIVLCKKKCTFNLEAGLVASLALLKHCIGYITDNTISDLLQDTLLKTIIHPCLRLLSSTRQLFPGGVAARLALASKLIECLYLLALRVNTEQRIVLVHTLQRFFLVFSKARGQKSEDVGVSRGSGGVEMANVPRVRDYDSTDSCSPPQTTMTPGTDTDCTKSKALEELYQAMNPQLAYWTYTPFANFFGETFMEQSLKNYSLIQELCSVYIKEQEELGHPVIGDPFLSDTLTSLPISEDTVNVNAVVVGNRIDLQEPIVIKPSSPGIPTCFSNSPCGQVLNKNMENNTRHLRGNWLAYWEHEIGRSGKDSHINVKQIKLQSYSGHSNSVRVLTVLDNENSFLSASRDKTVKVWSLRSKGDGSTVSGCQWTYSGHRKSVMALGFVERVRLAVSCDSIVHLWDPFVGRAVSQTDMKHSPVNTLRPLNPPSAAVLTANTDSTLRTFDTRVGSYVNELKVVASGAGLIRCISVSPAGTLVALGQASGYLTVLDLRTGIVVSSWKGHEGEVLQLLAINEQTVVSSSLDQAVSAWNVTEGKLKFNLKGPTEPVHCLDSYGSELISGTTANRIGVHSGIDAGASFSSTRLRTETFKGVLTALNVLPLNRLLLLGADTGGITLLC